MFKLSPSSLGLFLECQRCFWLEKHKAWKRPAGIFPSLPSGMDKILKEHFDRFREKKQLPPELCDNGHCENMQLFGSTENERKLLDLWRNNRKGIQWEDKKGNVLHGAVDDMLKKGSKLVILDFKTRGFPLKEDTNAMYQYKMDTYSLLLLKNNHQTENYGFLLYYMPSHVTESGEVVFNKELVKLKVDPSVAEKVFNTAIKVLNGDCPSKKCEWCEGI